MPPERDAAPTRRAIRKGLEDAGLRVSVPRSLDAQLTGVAELSGRVARSDVIVADVTRKDIGLFYLVGLAHSMGKPVFFVAERSAAPVELEGLPVVTYETSDAGLSRLSLQLGRLVTSYRRSPRRYAASRFLSRVGIAPRIELNDLEPRDFENMCFELLAQMGFRRLNWRSDIREIDLVATYPRMDPDGRDYNELWFVSLGTRAHPSAVLDRVATTMFRKIGTTQEIPGVDTNSPFTILFIT